MIPINTICDKCMGDLATRVEAMPDDGTPRNMLFWCGHNRVGGAVEVLPGKLLGHWILQPAASADAARAMFQIAAAENAALVQLAVGLAQAQKPAASIN